MILRDEEPQSWGEGGFEISEGNNSQTEGLMITSYGHLSSFAR